VHAGNQTVHASSEAVVVVGIRNLMQFHFAEVVVAAFHGKDDGT
jgi:hypothetical protein